MASFCYVICCDINQNGQGLMALPLVSIARACTVVCTQRIVPVDVECRLDPEAAVRGGVLGHLHEQTRAAVSSHLTLLSSLYEIAEERQQRTVPNLRGPRPSHLEDDACEVVPRADAVARRPVRLHLRSPSPTPKSRF